MIALAYFGGFGFMFSQSPNNLIVSGIDIFAHSFPKGTAFLYLTLLFIYHFLKCISV